MKTKNKKEIYIGFKEPQNQSGSWTLIKKLKDFEICRGKYENSPIFYVIQPNFCETEIFILESLFRGKQYCGLANVKNANYYIWKIFMKYCPPYVIKQMINEVRNKGIEEGKEKKVEELKQVLGISSY